MSWCICTACLSRTHRRRLEVSSKRTVRFRPIADSALLPQKAEMNLARTLAAVVSASLTALAFGADGASLGKVVVGATLIGGAVFLTAGRASSAWLSVLVAFIYLGSVSLSGVAASLIDRTVAGTSNEQIFSESTALMAVGLGWTICDFVLRKLCPTA